MSELSRTVLAGTGEVSRAYEGLATLKAKTRANKLQATRNLTDAFNNLGESMKGYASLRDAKMEEDDVKSVLDADALGQSTGDPQKWMAAIQAIRPKTAKAAVIRSKRLDAATEAMYGKTKLDLAEAKQFATQERWDADRAAKERMAEEANRLRATITSTKADSDEKIAAIKAQAQKDSVKMTVEQRAKAAADRVDADKYRFDKTIAQTATRDAEVARHNFSTEAWRDRKMSLDEYAMSLQHYVATQKDSIASDTAERLAITEQLRSLNDAYKVESDALTQAEAQLPDEERRSADSGIARRRQQLNDVKSRIDSLVNELGTLATKARVRVNNPPAPQPVSPMNTNTPKLPSSSLGVLDQLSPDELKTFQAATPEWQKAFLESLTGAPK